MRRDARAMFTNAMLALVVLLSPLAPAHAQERDVADARDYPGIGRFAGSLITGYQSKNFDAVRLQAAPFQARKPVDAQRLEGKVTRIAWRALNRRVELVAP